MEQQPTFFEKLNNWFKNSITIRLITITILILLLLIPVAMIKDLVWERQTRQQEAIAEVSGKWGEAQTITGPVLTVPYRTYIKVYENDDNTGKYHIEETKEYAHFLPDQLNINGQVLPEVRYRGIYEVIVYNSKIKLKGKFSPPSLEDWKIKKEDVLWEDAFLSIGLTDLRSIQQSIAVNWNGKDHFFNPGLESHDVIATGISTRLPMTADSLGIAFGFDLQLDFNGSTNLSFIPLGKVTQVNITSPWKNPSFDGAFLPDQREINEQGFNASWEVLHLNRPYPQKFTNSMGGIQESAFGINLIVPVDEYQKSTRSAKYAVMFITLTFLVFFFVQVLNRVRIHPLQYIMVGLALCVFYTLLIALSEHIPFSYSYLISSLAVISLITLYAKAMFKNKTLTRLIGLILVVLYLFIYSIIQMEDYALLMGSIGLFVVLATIMYLSRKIDWYAVRTNPEKENK